MSKWLWGRLREEEPSLNVTFPEGLKPVTVVVKVTDVLTVAGFADEVRATKVLLVLLDCDTTDELLGVIVVVPSIKKAVMGMRSHAQC